MMLVLVNGGPYMGFLGAVVHPGRDWVGLDMVVVGHGCRDEDGGWGKGGGCMRWRDECLYARMDRVTVSCSEEVTGLAAACPKSGEWLEKERMRTKQRRRRVLDLRCGSYQSIASSNRWICIAAPSALSRSRIL